MQRYSAGLAFSKDGTCFALIRKNRPLWQAGFLNAIGGEIEPGELPLDAMMREFREEASLQTRAGDWADLTTFRAAVLRSTYKIFLD
jgi:8-oxo-dGTP pyrophosphatase MutT (NUDIX family)